MQILPVVMRPDTVLQRFHAVPKPVVQVGRPPGSVAVAMGHTEDQFSIRFSRASQTDADRIATITLRGKRVGSPEAAGSLVEEAERRVQQGQKNIAQHLLRRAVELMKPQIAGSANEVNAPYFDAARRAHLRLAQLAHQPGHDEQYHRTHVRPPLEQALALDAKLHRRNVPKQYALLPPQDGAVLLTLAGEDAHYRYDYDLAARRFQEALATLGETPENAQKPELLPALRGLQRVLEETGQGTRPLSERIHSIETAGKSNAAA